MRVWVDMTNSPHVPFFRPLFGLLEERGHEVVVTARAFAQTLELLDAAGIPHDVVGPPHGGAGAAGKVRAMGARLWALRRFAKGRGFDIALSHASHELPIVARMLGIRSAYAYDYEFARAQHTLGSRAATRVVVPEAIPQQQLDRLGAVTAKTRRYPGLKEEYYLSSFTPDRSVLGALGIEESRVLVVVRTPPEVSLYHRHGSPLFGEVLERLGRHPGVHAVVLPRTPHQQATIAASGLPSLIVPDRAVDAQSLIALADLVVSAGGTMNREAVALGTPVWTTFAGRMGAVDEMLIADGRLRQLTAAGELELGKKDGSAPRTRRDPGLMLDLLLSALA
jgi:predicted glycosyltransferase